MPTDVPTFKARLLDERAAVVAEIAAVDRGDEDARLAVAEAEFLIAKRKRDKAARRYDVLVSELESKLAQLDAKIDLLTP